MARRPKSELIGQVLGRLAQDRYELRDEGDGELVVIKNYGPTYEEIEDFFAEELVGLEMLRDTIEEQEPGHPLAWGPAEENWDDFWTKELIRQIFGADSEWARTLQDPLRGKSYGQVISILYRLFTEGVQQVASEAVRNREVLTPQSKEKLEHWLRTLADNESADMIANEYARQLAGQFPRVVGRAENLQMLPVLHAVPTIVQQYLLEATKCYLHGRFIACLILCRSTLEFSLRAVLGRENKRHNLTGDESLAQLIETARTELPWRYKPTLDEADEVRKRARDAVHRHEKTPTPEGCRDMFERTRGILRELFSEGDGTDLLR